MELLKRDGLVLHYKWIDYKKPLTFLFINSLGTDFRIWDEVVAQLKDYGNVLLFDKRGHGLSDVVEATNGLDDFADDAEALLNKFNAGKFVVVGLSVGAYSLTTRGKEQPTSHIYHLESIPERPRSTATCSP